MDMTLAKRIIKGGEFSTKEIRDSDELSVVNALQAKDSSLIPSSHLTEEAKQVLEKIRNCSGLHGPGCPCWSCVIQTKFFI